MAYWYEKVNMNTLSLEEVKKIKLFSRIDKKYIIDFETFCNLTQYINDNYYILTDDNDNFLLKYKSIYFDTEKLSMFNDHENRKKNRQKIRIREYSNGDKYLEIKTKSKEDFTKKIRIELEDYNIQNYTDWINKNLEYSNTKLIPTIEIIFHRLTLINKEKSERITIDFGINFNNYITNKKERIKEIVIEVKKLNHDKTEFEIELNKLNIEESKFSKYHIGIQKTS